MHIRRILSFAGILLFSNSVASGTAVTCAQLFAAGGDAIPVFEKVHRPHGPVFCIAVGRNLHESPAVENRNPVWERLPLELPPKNAVESMVSLPETPDGRQGMLLGVAGDLLLYARESRDRSFTLRGYLKAAGNQAFSHLRIVPNSPDDHASARVFAEGIPRGVPGVLPFDEGATPSNLIVWDLHGWEVGPAHSVAQLAPGSRWAVLDSWNLLLLGQTPSGAQLSAVALNEKRYVLRPAAAPLQDVQVESDVAGFEVVRRNGRDVAQVLVRRAGQLRILRWHTGAAAFTELSALPSMDGAAWASLRLRSEGTDAEQFLLSGRLPQAFGLWVQTAGAWRQLAASPSSPGPRPIRFSPGNQGTVSVIPRPPPKFVSPPDTFEVVELSNAVQGRLVMYTRDRLTGANRGARAEALVDSLFVRMKQNSELGVAPSTRHARWVTYLVGSVHESPMKTLQTRPGNALLALLQLPIQDGRASFRRYSEGKVANGSPEQLAWETFFQSLARYLGEPESKLRSEWRVGKGEAELEPTYLAELEIELQSRDPLRGFQTYRQVQEAFD